MHAARIAVFLAIIFVINLVLHGYLWLRLVRAPGWPSPWGRVGSAALVGLAVLLSLSLYLMRVAPRGAVTVLAWTGFTWMGSLFLLFVLTLVTEPLRPLLRLLVAGTGGFHGSEGAEAGRVVARTMAAVVLVGGSILGVIAVCSARLPAAVRTVPVSIVGWPAALSGYTVVQISDIHVGETVGRDLVERVVRQVNAQDPDLIVITGDLVDGSVKDLGPLVAPLASLRARDGVWFVTGNHEYYSGASAWVEHVSALGIRVLRNERVPIRGEAGFDLAGTDDYSAGSFDRGHGEDIRRALAGRDPNRPVILLAHQPRSIVEAAVLGVDLQLSGHTHGGQMYPIHYLSKRAQGYLAGLHRRGNSWLYVSRGTGYWGPPMRLGAPPEITRIVITPRAPEPQASGAPVPDRAGSPPANGTPGRGPA